MEYNDISNEQLSIMIENILSGKPADMSTNIEPGYVDERAQAFIKSLQDMVK